MMKKQADSCYPEGLGGSGDISLAELQSLLVGRVISGVSFQESSPDINSRGTLCLTLDNGSTVVVRGQGNEIQCVDIVVADLAHQ